MLTDLFLRSLRSNGILQLLHPLPGYFFLPPNLRLSPQKTAIWGDNWNGILWNKVSLLFPAAQVIASQLWRFIQLCSLHAWSCFFSGLRFKRTLVNFKVSFQNDAKKTSKEADFRYLTPNIMKPWKKTKKIPAKKKCREKKENRF